MRVLLTWVQQITVSNTLLCPAMYCVKQNTVSTLALDIHLFNFPLLTCSGHIMLLEPSWPWSYGSWICNYLCNQCLPPLMLWNWISIRARCTRLCDKVCQWLATGRCFFLLVLRFPPPIKLTINTIKQTNISCYLLNLEQHDLTDKPYR